MERRDPTAPASPLFDEVTGALEALTAVLREEDDFRILLRHICLQVRHAVPGVDEASVTLVTGEVPHTATATSAVVDDLDGEQYRIGDGPCVEAIRGGKIVRTTVSDAVERWPRFADGAREAGFGSFLAAPLVADERFSGAVNCYGRQDDGFEEVEAQLLELYTAAVAAILRVYHRYLKARETAEHLRTALTSRAVIDQAKGMLMAIRQVDADDAFALLVEQSQRENVKLREVAERFVARVVSGHVLPR
ncbi:two-component system response regulator [Amycolatopsis mediterranei S699]|uniref:Two-component system response regulator n=2 Tax=Amycolatopsis mediterranei TaxID=33910 RepID=A0A0H3D5T1_AMYMU|nr:GAF and ANTAR domain-containing protein [Amycolatopsis mediterranei]ADJ45971.1 two-component system response regulator [Amycolatopsis mediterranei U32]AEK42754.1 two-component system response regulator [Amycolatopsis mediterranei S699]AFO77682.1 two-component system response regulator [Amycolatopsis mediterranei S699]AGT84810.1 two-component system response regulator [Amycolatopsis mediterranei RB]KDO05505.1 transcriptional regulator [Amycolatopsis mediterranei]